MNKFYRPLFLLRILLFVVSGVWAQEIEEYDTVSEILYSGDVDRLTDVLDKHNDINSIVSDDGVSILHLACSMGNKEIVNLLLEREADPAAISPYGTAANWAAEKGNMELVSLLIDNGLNPRIEEMSYWVDLYQKDMDIPPWIADLVEDVLEKKRPYNNYPYMEFIHPGDPLLLAASLTAEDDFALTKRLLEMGCNINLRDKRGLTALHISILMHNQEALELLIESGADVEQPVFSRVFYRNGQNSVYDNNATPLHLMLYLTQENPSSLDEHKDEVLLMLKTLLEAGADREAQLKDSGKTALEIALEIGNQEIIDLLKE